LIYIPDDDPAKELTLLKDFIDEMHMKQKGRMQRQAVLNLFFCE
jgi:hypothetical protein